MIKLIATDVDGTLVEDGTCRINPEYFTVIEQLRELGIHVAAASGRQADSLLSLFEPVRDKMFFISNNGGVMGTSSRILFVTSMDETLLQKLLEDCKAFPDCYLLLSAAEDSYYLETCPEDFVHLITEEYRFGAEPVKDWKNLPPIVKAAIYHDPALPHPARALIEPWEGRLTGVVSGREWVDFIGPGVSKGKALRELMESLSVSPEETMVFGDQMNDLPMMEQAKHSFAIGGAREEVKAAAAHVAAPMEEDGVLQVLKTLVKNKGLLLLMICLILFSSGCGTDGISVGGFPFSGMKSHELLVIGEDVCPMAEAMIFVTTQKNIYQDSYGGNIWSVSLEDGTFESYALEAIKSYMGRLFTVAKLARAEGYSLTGEEEIQVSEAAAHYIASMSAEDLELTGITEEVAQAAYEQYVLALRFYDDMIEEAGIEVSDDEARVIHIQKILIAAEGLTGEEREAQRAKAQEALEKARSSTDFAALASQYQEGDSLEFTVTREDLTTEEEKVAYHLNNGQISEIIETAKGFVIIKCLSSYDESATAVHKDKLLEERRNAVSNSRIKAFLEEHPAVFNDGAWNAVSISGYQGPATGNFYTSYQTAGNEEYPSGITDGHSAGNEE